MLVCTDATPVMTITRSFWLKPHVPLTGPYQVDIVGRVVRHKNLLTISYELLGDLDKTLQPLPSQHSERPIPFWQTTRLTCFIAPVGTSHYWALQLQPDYDWVECFSTSPSAWDFQISPNHDWTVLHYDDYRQNPQPKTDICTASYSLLSTPRALHTLLKIDLETLSLADQPLNIGLTAVTKLVARHTIYWALAHPKSGPDFHHPASFALPIAANSVWVVSFC